jgi:hypothetical protein
MDSMCKRSWQLIAEIKPFSPFIGTNPVPISTLLSLALEHGDMISVHTEERWQGSLDWLRTVRKLTTKPLLAKGIHDTDTAIERALDAGADKVLVVGRTPANHLLPFVYLEPLVLPDTFYSVPYVYNARNPMTGEKSTLSYNILRAHCSYLVQASLLESVDDVNPSTNAVLVGWNLPSFINSLNHAT